MSNSVRTSGPIGKSVGDLGNTGGAAAAATSRENDELVNFAIRTLTHEAKHVSPAKEPRAAGQTAASEGTPFTHAHFFSHPAKPPHHHHHHQHFRPRRLPDSLVNDHGKFNPPAKLNEKQHRVIAYLLANPENLPLTPKTLDTLLRSLEAFSYLGVHEVEIDVKNLSALQKDPVLFALLDTARNKDKTKPGGVFTYEDVKALSARYPVPAPGH